jgi:hypothetical protein
MDAGGQSRYGDLMRAEPRLFRRLRVVFRTAIAIQMVWMAVAPVQHLLSHATRSVRPADAASATSVCVEPSASQDEGSFPAGPDHAACAVCIVLAGQKCLAPAGPSFIVHATGEERILHASRALLPSAEPLTSLRARAPPQV